MKSDLNNMRTLILSDEDTFFELLEKFYRQIKAEDQEEYMTEKETMKLLGISSKSTLFQYRSNGLPYYQIGKRVILYKRSEVVQFIESHKVQGFSWKPKKK